MVWYGIKCEHTTPVLATPQYSLLAEISVVMYPTFTSFSVKRFLRFPPSMSALAILGGTPLSDPLSVQNNFLSMEIKSKQHKQTAFQNESDWDCEKLKMLCTMEL